MEATTCCAEIEDHWLAEVPLHAGIAQLPSVCCLCQVQLPLPHLLYMWVLAMMITIYYHLHGWTRSACCQATTTRSPVSPGMLTHGGIELRGYGISATLCWFVIALATQSVGVMPTS